VDDIDRIAADISWAPDRNGTLEDCIAEALRTERARGEAALAVATARIAEVERGRDEARRARDDLDASTGHKLWLAEEALTAARADAARLAGALRVAREHVDGNVQRSTVAEWVGREARAQLRMADEALAAHDAGTPAGGVWLTAEEAEAIARMIAGGTWSHEEGRNVLNKLRKARGGAR
jgi:hypothetical protein